MAQGAFPILTTEIRYEHDVVLARQRAREVARLLGFETQDQTRLATAVSELARNAFQYAGAGRVDVLLERGDVPTLVVRVSDRGPGIADLAGVLEGRYVSPTGMGLGIVGAQRLTDRFEIESGSSGTVVSVAKTLPPRERAVTSEQIAQLSARLAAAKPTDPFAELQQQNQELIQALDLLRSRQAEVERLNTELAETNRGVVALYAELDEKATALALASQHKSQFLSNISHELRTPLGSIINITRILLHRFDGPLTDEQALQVELINRSAQSLSTIVSDLLDLARVEAGKPVLRVVPTSVADILASLRGMFRPLALDTRVALIIEEPAEPMALTTDEGKVSQILRNLVSNALKFTEEGEVRLTVEAGERDCVRFTVSDTGIGIAAAHLDTIFTEFGQVDGPHQLRHRGSGLGLPLSRALAQLLGGTLSVRSTPGAGSTFVVEIPSVLADPVDPAVAIERVIEEATRCP